MHGKQHSESVKFESIRLLVDALPEVAPWPELARIFEKAGESPRPDWELPLLACRSNGGRESDALPGAAAIACLQLSIMLVDDVLDDDVRGAHHRYGAGQVANMALAFQAASIRLIKTIDIDDHRQAAIQNSLAKAALATAAGQHLDVQNFQGEENYWAVVSAKSTPFYGCALEVGSLIGNADGIVTSGLYQLGVLIGEIIQIEDDLEDSLAIPANADWTQGRNNLLILYALTANHKQRERFLELISQVRELTALREAQQILISSGAVGYAVAQLINRYQMAVNLLDSLDLP